MRNAVVKFLLDYGKKNKNLELITGDLGYGVLDSFWTELPNQFSNAGIAEQNMIGVAAGMAMEGKTVFVYSIGNFPTLRCLEQIRNDCAYHDLNVNIICVGSGFTYGALGMTHQATEDLSIMRSLPNVIVTSPCDAIEAVAIAEKIVNKNCPCYLRLGKAGERKVHNGPIKNFEIGKALKIKDGNKVAIFSTGTIISEALDSIEDLANQDMDIALYSFPTIKPIDKNLIIKSANKYDLIVTVEEHNIVGGLGSSVAEVIADNNLDVNFIRMGLNDVYSSVVGSQQYLREYYGLNSKYISKKILDYLNKY